MVNRCETCGRSITAHNSKKVSYLNVCVGCYEVMKTLEGMPRNEARKLIQDLAKESYEHLRAKGVQRPEQQIEEYRKYIQGK